MFVRLYHSGWLDSHSQSKCAYHVWLVFVFASIAAATIISRSSRQSIRIINLKLSNTLQARRPLFRSCRRWLVNWASLRRWSEQSTQSCQWLACWSNPCLERSPTSEYKRDNATSQIVFHLIQTTQLEIDLDKYLHLTACCRCHIQKSLSLPFIWIKFGLARFWKRSLCF